LDVVRVIHTRLEELKRLEFPPDLAKRVKEKLVQGADRTFLWAALTIEQLNCTFKVGRSSKEEIEELISSWNVDETYNLML
jgi:hypothetical protein